MNNHTTVECGLLKPRASEGSTATGTPKTCYYCALPGHLRNECPIRKRAIQAHGIHGPRKKQNTGTAAAAIAIAGSDHDYEDRTLH